MKRQQEVELMMEEIIQEVSNDSVDGISRFLQANPYISFELYNFKLMKDKPELFEDTFYYESENSRIFKEQICNILKNPNGKNTFFLVGYQGCGKTTFIHSVINKYKKETETKVVLIDCDKKGKDKNQILKTLCKLLKKAVIEDATFSEYVNFYNANINTIDELNDDNYDVFFNIIDEISKKGNLDRRSEEFRKLSFFINKQISIKEAFYLLIFWNLANNYHKIEKANEKLMFFIDNLDCIDEYYELVDFISCIDSLTVDMSEIFDKLVLCSDGELHDTYVSKIKIFIAMRETTKANLPSSHFSDALKSIYTNKDLTECYDKGEILRKRINKLYEFDKKGILKTDQKEQIQLALDIVDDVYTENVIYPLFNNNYRSAVKMLIKIIVSHTETMKKYKHLMNLDNPEYKHGARGILFKFIFDEFNEDDCFKRIDVLDLLNRKNNSVSICRLILSYLSNYTETKCDSGRNNISLDEILNDFHGIFPDEKIGKIFCEMFALRDTVWSHLISFNQIEYKGSEQQLESYINFSTLNPSKTMLHYSCAGKIYIEYVSTHFEFFTVRIFNKNRQALFCDSNLLRDNSTHNFKSVEIISRVYSEVEKCCASLKKFNEEICAKYNYLDPYIDTPEPYKNSHYICNFKRKEYSGGERRFKQFHEERIILTHINYIDCYRSYVLNYCEKVKEKEKLELNEELTECISKYVELLALDSILKNKNTNKELVEYYRGQIRKLRDDWSDFETIIRKN